MADQDNNEAAKKLEKLGQRIRAGYAKSHPTKHLTLITGSVREFHEKEVKGKLSLGSHSHTIERKPPGRDKGHEPER